MKYIRVKVKPFECICEVEDDAQGQELYVQIVDEVVCAIYNEGLEYEVVEE